VVGTKVRKALDAGSRLVTIDPSDSNLAGYTDSWLCPTPGKEGALLKVFAERLAGRKADASAAAADAAVDADALERALEVISSGQEPTVIIGPRAFHYDDGAALVDGLITLTETKKVNLIPLYFGTNARGAVEMGVFPELGPGSVARKGKGFGWAELLNGSKRPKVIYVVGDVAFRERPDCDFLIVQDTYLPPFKVDAFLPAASFAEAGGTLVNIEGRVQEVVRVENPPEGAVFGFMRPDWKILTDVARALGSQALNYESAADVRKDIKAHIPGFPAEPDRQPRQMKPLDQPLNASAGKVEAMDGDFWLVAEPSGYRHRGIDIASKVGGLCELALEDGFRMHPEDVESLGLAAGDKIRVTWDDGRAGARAAVKVDPECFRGAVYFTKRIVPSGLKLDSEPAVLQGPRQNPARVRISRVED
jgi:hypothetical protein